MEKSWDDGVYLFFGEVEAQKLRRAFTKEDILELVGSFLDAKNGHKMETVIDRLQAALNARPATTCFFDTLEAHAAEEVDMRVAAMVVRHG